MDIGGGEGLRHYTALENTEDGSRGQKAREALYERCAQRDEGQEGTHGLIEGAFRPMRRRDGSEVECACKCVAKDRFQG